MKLSFRSLTAAALLAAAVSAGAGAADPARNTRALSIEPEGEARSRIVEVMVHVPTAGKSQQEASEAGLQAAMDAALALAAEQVPSAQPKDLVVQTVDYREYPVSNGKLPVTLTAEVKAPAVKAPATQLMVDQGTGEIVSGTLFTAAQTVANAPLEVRVWTQRKEFAEGDEMVIRIRGNRDFHGRLMYRDVEGHLMQILPNAYRADTMFKANTDYVVPGPGDKFRLRVSAPFGEETIILMASTKPLGDIMAKDAGNGVLIADASLDQVASKSRALKLEPVAPVTPAAAQQAAVPQIGGAEFIEWTWKVTTRAK